MGKPLLPEGPPGGRHDNVCPPGTCYRPPAVVDLSGGAGTSDSSQPCVYVGEHDIKRRSGGILVLPSVY